MQLTEWELSVIQQLRFVARGRKIVYLEVVSHPEDDPTTLGTHTVDVRKPS